MKPPRYLVFCALLARAAFGEGASAPSISNNYSPPADIRKPDLTISGRNSEPAGPIAYDPNGRFLAAGGTDNAIRVYYARPSDRFTVDLAQTLTGHTAPVLAIGFSGANTLVSVSMDQTAKIWDIASGKLLHSADLNCGKKLVPMIAPGAEPFLAGGSLKQVRLWNYRTGVLLKSFEANDSDVAALAFTPDGKLLVIGTTKGVVRVMDVVAWKGTRTIDLDTPVRSLAASMNHIAVGYADGTVALLDFADQSTIPEVKKQHGAILAVAFSPKGEKFAAASMDNTVKVWDTETLKLLCSLEHTAAVLSVTFSPDGQKIAAGNADGNVIYSTLPLP